MRKFAFIVLLVPVALGGCGGKPRITPDSESTARGPIGPTVTVDAGKTVVGFARGVLRQTVDTKSFSIMKYPVTKKEYLGCVNAGACGVPTFEECRDSTLPAAAMSGPDDNAALCVGYENAKAYCGYVGGRLPTLPEWMRAARGADVRAYPWGDTRASCAQHPRSAERELALRLGAAGKISLDGCASADADGLRVGQHPAGKSPSGIEDVLLVPAELIEGSSAITKFGACGAKQVCMLRDQSPGAIGFVSTYSYEPVEDTAGKARIRRLASAIWGFRCAA